MFAPMSLCSTVCQEVNAMLTALICLANMSIVFVVIVCVVIVATALMETLF